MIFFYLEFISDFGEVISVKINHNATKASILIAQEKHKEIL